MAAQPVPNDREVKAAIEKLQGYSAYKSKQLQAPPGDSAALELSLQTVETWAVDTTDDAEAWAKKKEADSDQKIETAEGAQEQVKKDQEEAVKETGFRDKLDMPKMKTDMKSQLADYLAAMQQLADDGKPGFKEKLPEAKEQVEGAKKFIDEDFEKSMNLAAEQSAAKREQRKKLADRFAGQAEEGKKWKDEYGGRPTKFPEGQRADVEAALDQLNQLAGDKISEIQPLGAKSAAHIAELKKIQAWAGELKPKVTSTGKDLHAAKGTAKAGAGHARETFTKIGQMQDSVEGEANESMDTYQRWTNHNNRLAEEWGKSDSPKHKQWAEEWMKTQQ